MEEESEGRIAPASLAPDSLGWLLLDRYREGTSRPSRSPSWPYFLSKGISTLPIRTRRWEENLWYCGPRIRCRSLCFPLATDRRADIDLLWREKYRLDWKGIIFVSRVHTNSFKISRYHSVSRRSVELSSDILLAPLLTFYSKKLLFVILNGQQS